MRTLSLLLLTTSSLLAQSVTVPAANANSTGTSGTNTIFRNSGAPRTYMLGDSAAELAGIPVGDMLVGISFRAYSGTTVAWPANNVTWTDYEITVGPSVAPSAFSTTFMANFIGAPTLVRDGAMTIPASTYGVTGTPKPWGEFYFNFQTPVPYAGGDLGIMFSHPGSNDPTNMFGDIVASNAGAHGVAMTASTFQAVTGGAATTSFYVHRLHYGYGTGCPGTGNQTPVLVENANVDSAAGGNFLFTTSNVPANAPAVIAFGFGRATVPLPNGCTILTNPVATNFFLCDALGNGTQGIQVPPGFAPFAFNAQVVVLDAGATGGFSASNGVQPTVL